VQLTAGDTKGKQPQWGNLLGLLRGKLAATPVLLLFENAEHCVRFEVRAATRALSWLLC
jgi:hypothetical protein